jgi:hypothetical protein
MFGCSSALAPGIDVTVSVCIVSSVDDGAAGCSVAAGAVSAAGALMLEELGSGVPSGAAGFSSALPATGSTMLDSAALSVFALFERVLRERDDVEDFELDDLGVSFFSSSGVADSLFWVSSLLVFVDFLRGGMCMQSFLFRYARSGHMFQTSRFMQPGVRCKMLTRRGVAFNTYDSMCCISPQRIVIYPSTR